MFISCQEIFWQETPQTKGGTLQMRFIYLNLLTSENINGYNYLFSYLFPQDRAGEIKPTLLAYQVLRKGGKLWSI